MNRVVACMLGVGLLITSASFAEAADESEVGKTIGLLGINGATASVVVDEPTVSSDCFLGGFITFDPSTTFGRIFYATLLAAKMKGSIVNITYTQEGAVCTIKQVNVL